MRYWDGLRLGWYEVQGGLGQSTVGAGMRYCSAGQDGDVRERCLHHTGSLWTRLTKTKTVL